MTENERLQQALVRLNNTLKTLQAKYDRIK